MLLHCCFKQIRMSWLSPIQWQLFRLQHRHMQNTRGEFEVLQDEDLALIKTRESCIQRVFNISFCSSIFLGTRRLHESFAQKKTFTHRRLAFALWASCAQPSLGTMEPKDFEALKESLADGSGVEEVLSIGRSQVAFFLKQKGWPFQVLYMYII